MGNGAYGGYGTYCNASFASTPIGRTYSNEPRGTGFVLFAGANSIFAGDKLLTTPNPDINEDMRMLNELGIRIQKPFETHPQPTTVEAADSQYHSLGENPKWTRPTHKIERNEEKKRVKVGK